MQPHYFWPEENKTEWKRRKQKTEQERSNLVSANKSDKNIHRGTDGQKIRRAI